MAKRNNGYIKLFFIVLAIAGIIWNAAVLHNEVSHMKDDIREIKTEVEFISTYLIERSNK